MYMYYLKFVKVFLFEFYLFVVVFAFNFRHLLDC